MIKYYFWGASKFWKNTKVITLCIRYHLTMCTCWLWSTGRLFNSVTKGLCTEWMLCIYIYLQVHLPVINCRVIKSTWSIIRTKTFYETFFTVRRYLNFKRYRMDRVVIVVVNSRFSAPVKPWFADKPLFIRLIFVFVLILFKTHVGILS